MDQFVKVYKSWLATRQEAARKELTAAQRVAMAKIDNEKRRMWNDLPESRRKQIVEELVKEKILPDAVLTCMEIFDAKVISI